MADQYPRVTWAPQGLQCYFCEAEAADAKAENRSGFVYALGPKCRALLAAPPEREVFEGAGCRQFRADGKGYVETRTTGEWESCFRPGNLLYIGMHNPENARAFAAALESGRGQ